MAQEDASIPASPPSWHGKYPHDMTDEELRLAKEYVWDELDPLQRRLNLLSSAAQHLDYEINVRFRMGNFAAVNPVTLPEYPAATLGVDPAVG